MIPLIKATVILINLTACWWQRFASFQASQPQVKVEFHRAVSNPGNGLIEVADPLENKKVYIYSEAIITNKDIVEASVAEAPGMGEGGVRKYYQVVKITITEEAAERMAKFTALHLGESLAVLIDGKVASVALIIQEIHDKVQITGDMSKEEAERIAKALNSK